MKSHGRQWMRNRRKGRLQWNTRGPECCTVEVSMHGVTGAVSEKVMDAVADLVYTRFCNVDVYVGANMNCNLDGECR